MVYSSRVKKSKKTKNMLVSIIAIIVGIVIVMYLLTLINVPVLSNINGYAIHIISTIKSSVSGVFELGTGYFGDIKTLKKENTNLKTQINDMYYELLDMEVLSRDNDNLREMLAIDESYSHYTKIYANVILHSLDNYNNTLVINKGNKAGIKIKQTVITADGLVGYISNVSDYTSIVTTVLDTSSAISVQISSINKLAMAKGDYDLINSNQMKLINIPIDTEVAINEKVYTSGIGIYQKDIKIGEIGAVVNKKNEIDRYAIIESAVDFESLTTLAIIVE